MLVGEDEGDNIKKWVVWKLYRCVLASVDSCFWREPAVTMFSLSIEGFMRKRWILNLGRSHFQGLAVIIVIENSSSLAVFKSDGAP